MICKNCSEKMSGLTLSVWAGESWHERECIKFECEKCNIVFIIETSFSLSIFLLKNNNAMANKIGLLLSKDYQLTENGLIKKNFK